ncbi:MAG: hypothetical protein VX574_05795 [Myxococcota bacterium]|nr:hypothetical protein [Myxococcota bacterium]
MTPSTPEFKHVSPGGEAVTPGEIVMRVGKHPATQLGLRLECDDDDGETQRECWLIASCLFGGRASREQALASARALGQRGASTPYGVVRIEVETLAEALEEAGHPQPGAAAALLARLAAALVERGPGALETIGREADGLEDLGSRLAALAPGFGTARITRFLQPLRDTWPAAAELPLDPNACRAAFHLGWLGEEDDDPAALRATLEGESPEAALADCEFALSEIGRQSCRRERPERCLLGPRCPQRAADTAQ